VGQQVIETEGCTVLGFEGKVRRLIANINAHC
jgi:hypothetical protein